MSDTPPTALTLFLAEHDVPCPNPTCRFNLRGLTGTTCPECKETLVLRVGPPDALWNMRNWIVTTAAIGLVTNLIVAVTMSIVLGINTFYFGPSRTLDTANVMHLVIAFALGAGLVRYRAALNRRDPRAASRLLASLLVATIVQYALLILESLSAVL